MIDLRVKRVELKSRSEGYRRQKKIFSALCYSSSGFTLLELLAAMSITAIIAVTVLSLFSKGIDIWEDVTFRGSSEYNAALFLEEFEKDLKNCINFSEIQFLGESITIDFPAIISKNSGSSQEAVGRIRYSFDKDGMAVYKHKAAYPDCIQENLFGSHKILGSVESLSFEYAVLNAEGTLDWAGFWQDKHIIPEAVRVRIKFATNKDSGKSHNFERVVYIPVG